MSEATATDIPPAAETTTATPAAAESGPSKTTPAEQTTATTAQDTQQGGDAGTAAAPAAEPPKQQQPEITFKVQYGKQSQELKRPATSTIADLKAEVEKVLSIAPSMQKLMFKGLLKNDTDTLEKVGIKNGAKVLLIGSSQADIAAAKPAGAAGGEGSKLNWDAPKVDEDITKLPQHAKVIAKGVPEDAMAGISDRQIPLPDEMVEMKFFYNNMGNKVRLTFKAELQQLWIASATNTQKIAYASITKIDSYPIKEHEGYSVLALHLGAGGTSKYYLYFVPSQYVAGIKIRLIGVQALL